MGKMGKGMRYGPTIRSVELGIRKAALEFHRSRF